MSEISRLNSQIKKSEDLLNNSGFITKAPKEKIKLEEKKLKDFKSALKVHILTIKSELNRRLKEPFITYFIEEIRFSNYSGELFSSDYFDVVNGNNPTDEELEILLSLYNTDDGLYKLFKNNCELL